MVRHLRWILLAILSITHNSCQGKILRNNALMNKMMSHFQNNAVPVDVETEAPREVQKPEKILTLMQSVLCRNFPTIPCDVIVADEGLRKLLERSLQQLAHKKVNLDKSTVAPGLGMNPFTVYPVINSEDLSNFLQVAHTGYFDNKQLQQNSDKKRKSGGKSKNYWSHERQAKKKIKGQKETKRGEVYSGRKKIRKFYPHKIKYKDKYSRNGKGEFRDYSDEKLSMSVEVPDLGANRKDHLAYKVESNDPPVWRIDYMKHGEPSLNMFAYEDDRLRGKIVQTGHNVIVDENVLEQAARKEVLHPDVYIKKNYVKKGVNMNSEGTE